MAAGRLPAEWPAAQGAGLLGRITYDSSLFAQPRINLAPLRTLFRDELIDIEYTLRPLSGPAYNPTWYKVADGYLHSSFVQIVQDVRNAPLAAVPDGGQLGRVSVPFTQPYTFSRQGGWQVQSLFLLYYDTLHWITAMVDGPDGQPWYQITEAWGGPTYYAAADALQAVPPSEMSPISPDVPASQKRIEVSLQAQQLTAYEGDVIKLRVPISSGVRNSGGAGLPTQTPVGTFNIYSKHPSLYMGDSRLTDMLGDRFLPGVPWTCFFAEGGYAIHGTYWHSNFGVPMSKGCINLRTDHAAWLYRWCAPVGAAPGWEASGRGTQLVVS